MNGEGSTSQVPRRHSAKRPARIAVSDSEDEELPRANGKSPAKRPRESFDLTDEDLADLESENGAEGSTSRLSGRAGNEEGVNGDEGVDGNVGEEVRRNIGYRPEYDRGDDG